MTRRDDFLELSSNTLSLRGSDFSALVADLQKRCVTTFCRHETGDGETVYEADGDIQGASLKS